jgi:hypothetical protein
MASNLAGSSRVSQQKIFGHRRKILRLSFLNPELE